MLHIEHEIDQLRNKLNFKYPGHVYSIIIENMMVEARGEISEAVSDVLAEAIDEAAYLGEEMQAYEFVQELRAIRVGGSFEIITDSGKTDWSTPPRKMLPDLLKNAKVSKEGTRYKVIPIKDTGVTTEAIMQNLASKRKQNRLANRKNKGQSANKTISEQASELAALMYGSAASHNVPGRHDESTATVTHFRTASSKQDESTMWVHPGQKKDMTANLRRINDTMLHTIDDSVKQIITKYEGY